MPQAIPIHYFSRDDDTSVPFRFVPLERKSHYDSSTPHRHNYYEIFIFLQGGGNHTIDFTNHEIKSNSIHFVSPGQVHQVDRELDTHGSVILFSREFYSSTEEDKRLLFELPFLNNNSPMPVLNLNPIEIGLIENITSEIHEEYNSSAEQRESLLRSYLNILLLKCHKFYAAKTPAATLSHNASLLKSFRMHLESKFGSLHKVREYAELLNTTEKTLNETLKNQTGRTASEHIFDRIILEAKRLLKHSDMSAKEIGYYLGFQDPAHFSRFFKAQAGSTPNEFRAKE